MIPYSIHPFSFTPPHHDLGPSSIEEKIHSWSINLESGPPSLKMPDIDSINQSVSLSRAYSNGTHSPSHHSPSRHASISSLAATATINAGFQNEESRRSSTSSNRGRPSPQVSRTERERRRSNAFLGSYDPALPGPGELQVGDLRGQSFQGINVPFRSASPQAIGSPTMGSQRDRAPSLGELHQELEAEQEAQVVSKFLNITYVRSIYLPY